MLHSTSTLFFRNGRSFARLNNYSNTYNRNTVNQFSNTNRQQNCPLFLTSSRYYADQGPTLIPKINEDDITDRARDVATRLLKLDYIAMCQFLTLLKDKTGVDPDAGTNMGGGGGAAGNAAEEKVEIKDTGFRKIVIREFKDGNLPVKDKFAIMKIMRAEQPDLSLADVGYLDLIYKKWILFT